MTRAEHLQWAKDRALEYLDRGELVDAVASFGSDLNKHDELRGHASVELLAMHALSGLLDARSARELIEGAA